MKRSIILGLVASLALGATALAQAGSAPHVAPVPLTSTAPVPSGVTLKEVRFFSEQVEVSGRLFSPASVNNAPVVVLAPGWGKTAASLDAYAAALAGQGIVALIVDYRGWGRSGGYLYLGERIQFDDRQRFSDHTPIIIIRRGRLEPNFQVEDIRNAISFAQGLPGVDKSKVGVVGVDMAGGHVISTIGMDGRVKAGVAITPIIQGQAVEKKSLIIPSKEINDAMIKLARTGAPPKTAAEAKARNALESKIAVGEYMPFWRIDAIPNTAAIAFITAGNDEKVKNETNAVAASKALKGPTEVKVLAGAKHELTAAQVKEAAAETASWMKSKL